MCREILKQCCPVDVPTRMETVYTYTTNTGCLAHALACLYRSQTQLSREDAVRNGPSPPTSIISQDQSPPTDMAAGQPDQGSPSIETPSSQLTLVVPLTSKN